MSLFSLFKRKPRPAPVQAPPRYTEVAFRVVVKFHTPLPLDLMVQFAVFQTDSILTHVDEEKWKTEDPRIIGPIGATIQVTCLGTR